MLLEQELDQKIGERISVPIVKSTYYEWVRRGMLTESQNFLNQLPDKVRAPIEHGFITHVHKEKGLFVHLIGEEIGCPDATVNALAMSADMLWCLSLIIDDIEDGDTTRGGLESSWKKFGISETEAAAHYGLKSLLEHLVLTTESPLIARSCMAYVSTGLVSIKEHNQMDLNTPLGEITRNYERRCDFHGTFPLAFMAYQTNDNRSQIIINQAIGGLRLFNQGGQLINDLKDFVNGDLYGRSFSDIRRAVPTIPLKMMYDQLSSQEKSAFMDMFGKETLTAVDRNQLSQIVDSSRIVPRVLARIEDCYTESLALFTNCLDKNRSFWFTQWASYKLDHIRKILGEK